MTQRQQTSGSEITTRQAPHFTRRRVIQAAAVATLGTQARWAFGQPAPGTDGPCLAVWQHESLRPSAKSNSGLRIAVWPDGAILFSPVRARLGEHMLIGAVETADLEAALKTIRTAGFFKLTRDYLVPDSGSTTIAVRDHEGSSAHSFHAYLMPGFGGDLNTDAEYRRFVRTWMHTHGAIESLAPVRLERLGDRQEYRGYSVAEQRASQWQNARQWTPLPKK